jgi:hypothetical protein
MARIRDLVEIISRMHAASVGPAPSNAREKRARSSAG